MKSGNTDYLPLNQALILEGGEDEGEELKREVQELHEVMNQRFKTMNLHFDTRLDAIEVCSYKACRSVLLAMKFHKFLFFLQKLIKSKK